MIDPGAQADEGVAARRLPASRRQGVPAGIRRRFHQVQISNGRSRRRRRRGVQFSPRATPRLVRRGFLPDPPVELDKIARGKLRVGKKVDAERIILAIPAGMDAMPVVSRRPSLVETAKVFVLDNHDPDSSKIRARIHVTMAGALGKAKLSRKERLFKEEHKIGKCHPFYSWKVGDVIKDVRCVAVYNRDGVLYVELSNLVDPLPLVVSDLSQLPPGTVVSTIVTSVSATPSHHGLWVQVCPGVSGFVCATELSADADNLNDLPSTYKIGARIPCCVTQNTKSNNKRPLTRRQLQANEDHDDKMKEQQALELSALLAPGEDSAVDADGKRTTAMFKPMKPRRGDTVVGRICAKFRALGPPALMISLRGGYIGRYCVTELADVDDWENMPLGTAVLASASDGKAKKKAKEQQRVVSSDSEAGHSRENEGEDEASDEENNANM